MTIFLLILEYKIKIENIFFLTERAENAIYIERGKPTKTILLRQAADAVINVRKAKELEINLTINHRLTKRQFKNVHKQF